MPRRAWAVPVSIVERGRSTPQQMDAGFQDALERAAEKHAPGLHVRMPSGAGHDAQILAERMKSAMLFVPSIGGISHHYAENTKDEDIVLGCQVLADGAAMILGGWAEGFRCTLSDAADAADPGDMPPPDSAWLAPAIAVTAPEKSPPPLRRCRDRHSGRAS